MNNAAADSLIKLFIFLPLIIILIYLVLRYEGKYLMKLGSGRIIKIVERVPLSNKGALIVAIINGKPYVISSTEQRNEILMELPQECIDNNKTDENSFLSNLEECLNTLLKRKGTR